MNGPLALLVIALAASPDAGALRASGSLDKEAIKGVIASHINEVKYCYERELTKMPDLFGTVWVEFTIEATGEVSVSNALKRSTTRQAPVESCIAAAVRRWRFPETPGGGVLVTYPLVLTPAPAPIPIARQKDGTSTFDITVVEPTAIVHTSKNAQGIPSNGLIAVTDGGLLLIDTAWTDAQTEAILAWGTERLGRPWIGAVITHEHADRDGGLGALQRRHIPVAALDLTVAKLEKRGVRGVSALFSAKAAEFKDPRGFEAFYPGPGHAPDNIVVSFPNVLFGGCLIKSREAKDLGFTGDADLAHWPEAVRRVAARYEDEGLPVIPGHGPVDTTSRALQHTLDLLAAAPKK
ncbi:MAG TPA: AgmX/PglI C-terminal domain-containing protein [Polyangia bacterium]